MINISFPQNRHVDDERRKGTAADSYVFFNVFSLSRALRVE